MYGSHLKPSNILMLIIRFRIIKEYSRISLFRRKITYLTFNFASTMLPVQERNVTYQTMDRQWDIRLNVPTDDYLEQITTNIMEESTTGRLVYALIGGLEIGTKPNQTDYKCRHVHIALIFHNRKSKSSIMKTIGVIKGHSYYMVPRNRSLPYSGWKKHHIKEFSKVDKEKLKIFEYGELPKDMNQKVVLRSEEEKKRKIDDILIDMRKLIEEDKEDEAFNKFPRNYLIYGSRIKAMIHQKADFFKERKDPHIWVFGQPGTGKTAIMKYIYPKTYKKNLDNKFWDLYDDKIHDHVMLEDLDPDAVENKLGIQFLKTVCDEAGFACDQKYKTPQLTRSTILVSSNFTIPEIVPNDTKGYEITVAALQRRFFHLRIDNLMRLLGVKLIDKYDRTVLAKNGNQDVSKLFMSYDYILDCPTGLPIKTPEEYQECIRDYYYKC